MLEKTKLEVMSSELPERERRELLARITRGQDREEADAVRRVELKAEERDRLIGQELAQSSLWTRFVLWLMSLFTGRSRKDLFLSSRIAQLKRSIKAASPGISGFETRNLTPRFARQLYDLYAASYPLRDLFQTFAREEAFREGALSALFEAKYPEARRELSDLVPLSEMEAAYTGSGNEEEVRKIVLRRYNDYFKKVPDKLFHLIEEGLKPLLLFRGVVLFPYSLVFRHFNYFPGERLEDKYPYFDNGSAMLVLDLLERLIAGLTLVARLGGQWFCHEELLQYYLRYRAWGGEEAWNATRADLSGAVKPAGVQLQLGEAGAGAPPGGPGGVDAPSPANGLKPGRAAGPAAAQAAQLPEPGSQELAGQAEELARALAELAEAAGQFDRRVPLLHLLRYFRRDPYLRLEFSVPRLQLRPIYAALLREKFLGQLAEKLALVKQNVIERRLRDIFRSEQLLELFYYNERTGYDFRQLGLPHFTHTRSLMVFYNFLSKIYKGFVQEAVQAANSYVFAGNRMVQTRLLQNAGGLEELEAKIVLLDRSLSPEEEDGRALGAFRNRVSTDTSQQKLYRSLVAQKDKEAHDLLEQGIDHLQSIKRHFDETVASPVESIKAILKTLHFSRGRNQTLAALLRSTAELIGDFLELLRQLSALEKGA
jgi:hypothetical protein